MGNQSRKCLIFISQVSDFILSSYGTFRLRINLLSYLAIKLSLFFIPVLNFLTIRGSVLLILFHRARWNVFRFIFYKPLVRPYNLGLKRFVDCLPCNM